jgi:hypothetical protein
MARLADTTTHTIARSKQVQEYTNILSLPKIGKCQYGETCRYNHAHDVQMQAKQQAGQRKAVKQ